MTTPSPHSAVPLIPTWIVLKLLEIQQCDNAIEPDQFDKVVELVGIHSLSLFGAQSLMQCALTGSTVEALEAMVESMREAIYTADKLPSWPKAMSLTHALRQNGASWEMIAAWFNLTYNEGIKLSLNYTIEHLALDLEVPAETAQKIAEVAEALDRPSFLAQLMGLCGMTEPDLIEQRFLDNSPNLVHVDDDELASMLGITVKEAALFRRILETSSSDRERLINVINESQFPPYLVERLVQEAKLGMSEKALLALALHLSKEFDELD